MPPKFAHDSHKRETPAASVTLAPTGGEGRGEGVVRCRQDAYKFAPIPLLPSFSPSVGEGARMSRLPVAEISHHFWSHPMSRERQI